jgi:hypothetical protein
VLFYKPDVNDAYTDTYTADINTMTTYIAKYLVSYISGTSTRDEPEPTFTDSTNNVSTDIFNFSMPSYLLQLTEVGIQMDLQYSCKMVTYYENRSGPGTLSHLVFNF